LGKQQTPNEPNYQSPSEFAHYFTTQYENEQTFRTICIRYFNLLIDALNKDVNDKFRDENLRNDFSEDLLKQIDQLMKKEIKNDEHLLEYSPSPIKYKYRRPLIFIFDDASKMELTHSGRSTDSSYSNFSILLKLIESLQKNVFVLFVDSSFSLLLNHKYETNHLVNDDKSTYSLLFNPNYDKKICSFGVIYLLPTWDVHVDYESIKNIQESVKLENVCKYGRPLWTKLYEGVSKNLDETNSRLSYYHVINDLTSEELINGRVSRLDCNGKLAIWSTRIGYIPIKSLTIKQNLVAKHFAILMHENIDSGIFDIDYPSEPLLADAASGVLNNEKIYNPGSFDELKSKEFEQSLVTLCNLYPLIESSYNIILMVAKIILIRSMDLACLDRGEILNIPFFSLKYVKVDKFLQKLYGEEGIDIINQQYSNTNPENAEKLLNAYLNFNHFTKSNFNIKDVSLINSIRRCAAIDCSSNQQNIFDLVIPITFNLTNFDEISAIVIKVKCYPENIKDVIFEDINFQMLGIENKNSMMPYLIIHMNLVNVPDNRIFCLREYNELWSSLNQSKYRSFIYSQSISYIVFKCFEANQDSIDLLNDLIKKKFSIPFPNCFLGYEFDPYRNEKNINEAIQNSASILKSDHH
jgi:hypothetical protein